MSDVLYYCRQIPAAMLPLRVYGLHGFLRHAVRLPVITHVRDKYRVSKKETAIRPSIKTTREFARRAVNRP